MKFKFYFFLITFLCGATQIYSIDHYWVGGSGKWNDPNHWASADGGKISLGEPTSNDNVFFTSNSFLSKKNNSVHIGDGVACAALDFSGIKNSLAVVGNKNSFISVGSNLWMSDKVSFQSIQNIVFNSSFADNKIDFKNAILPTNVFFSGGGKWNLFSNINFSDNKFCKILNGEIIKNGFRIENLEDRSGFENSRDNCTLTITSNIIPTTCSYTADGGASVEVSGGSGLYSYLWTGNNFSSNADSISNLSSGGYTLVVTDDTTVCLLFLTVPGPFPLVLVSMFPAPSTKPPTCFGLCNGKARPIIGGGNSGGYTYLWSSGETTQAAIALCDPFHLTVTDSKGCVLDTNYKYPNGPLPIKFEGSTKTDILCNGQSTGAINLQISGGTPGYNKSWTTTSPPGYTSSNEDITNLLANTYHVLVTDANNCPKDTSFIILQSPPIIISSTKTDNLCAGGNNGSININVTGGNPFPAYTYSWNFNGSFFSTTKNLTGLFAGTYQLTVTDGNSCQKIVTIIITEPPAIQVSAIVTNVLCYGGNNASIDLTLTGGVPLLNVSWTGTDYLNNSFAASTQDIFNLKAGNYLAVITDANNCIKDTSISITQPAIIAISDSVFNVSCFGANNGAIDLTIVGGIPNYSFLWNGPGSYTSTSEDITNLLAGNYIVTVTDNNGCFKNANYNIIEPTQINILQTIQNVNCNGDSTGSILVAVTGGTPLAASPFYTFNWTNVSNSSLSDQINLPDGNYSLTVTDFNNCSVTENYVVSETPAIVLNANVTNNICSYDSAGSIDLIVTGGQIPYGYIWTPNIQGFQNQDIFNLGTGNYAVEVTDAFGCKADSDFDILSNLPIVAVANISNVKCNGGSDGSVSLTISGGDPNFQVSWSKVGGGFSSVGTSIVNITAGFYIYLITDASNCTLVDTAEVTEPLPLLLNATVTAPFCNNVNDGSIVLQISQGTAPYTILWNPLILGNNDTITNLGGGTYSALVTDSAGCTISGTYTLVEQQEIVINADIVNIQCNGLSSGSIDLSITGGLSPYNLLWTGPSINAANENLENIINLFAGTYNLAVTDSVGCSATKQYVVNEATPIQLSYTKTDVACFGSSTGFIDLTISGGTPDYDFEWLAPIVLGNNEDQAGLIAGFYTITVIDQDLCSIDTTIEILENIPIQISATIINAQCSGINSGEIFINVSGGISGYTFEWAGSSITSGNINDEDLTNLATGNYQLTITDAIGCEKDTAFFVGQEDPITATFNVTNILCNGFATGAIDATVTSTNTINLLNWSYLGNFFSNVDDIAGLNAGDYNIFITDTVGCNYSDTITITQPENITLSPTVVDVDCNGNSNATIATNPSGGTLTYDFTWTGGNITPLIESDQNLLGLISGNYTLNILDGNNCSFDTTIIITEPSKLIANFNVSEILCNGQTASISGSVSGGTLPYIIKWKDATNAVIATTLSVSNLVAGNYFLSVSDANGCSIDSSITIAQPDSLGATFNITTSHCLSSDGEIIANAFGGVLPFNYLWQNTNGDTLSISNILSAIPAGNYNFTMVDSNNCTFNQLVALSDSGATVSAVKTDLTCYEIANGSIDISIVGGTSPFSYNWVGPSINTTILNNQNLQDIAELLVGDYGVTITDSIGCVFANVTNIQQPDSISIFGLVNNVRCFGTGNGSIDISVSGGTPDYSASWTSANGSAFTLNANGQDISALQPDSFIVTITDANNCINNSAFLISQPAAVSVLTTVTNITCNNANNGIINTVAFGGMPPYQFSWSGGIVSTNQNLSNLAAGQYNLTVTDSNNCSFDTLFVLVNPTPIIISTTVSNSICLQANGGAQATAIGGTIVNDYTYSWIDADSNLLSNQASLIGVSAGIYQINILDDNNCLGISTVAISDTNGFIQASITPVNCVDSTSGEINITVIGATGDIAYLWGDPLDSISTNEDLIYLTIGTYSITATDSIGCVFTSLYNLDAPVPIDATAILSNLNCFNDESGAIDITITGGLEPYEIRWNNSLLPVGQQDLANLDANIYNLNITDALGCVYENSYTVVQNSILSASLIIVQPSCLVDTLGSVTGTFTGGVAPFTINWSGPNSFASSQINIAGLQQGVYCLDITDSLGCNYDTCITIVTQSQIIIQLDTVLKPLCFNSTDGAIDITISGTIGDIIYTWLLAGDTIANTEDVINLAAGIYTLVVADESGCEKLLVVELTNNDSITIDATITNALCLGSETGSIELNTTGGTPTYNFEWSFNGIILPGDSILNNISSGQYVIVVTDANNCILTDTIFVAELTSFDISSVTITDAQCSTDTTAAVSILTTGGTADFIYNWTGVNYTSTEQNITNILPGDYTITITDANNCMADSTISVGYLFEISANAGLDTTVCPENFPLLLTGAGLNNSASSWINLNGDLLSNDSILSYSNVSSSDTLIYITTNSSCSASDTVVVTMLPNAIADAGQDQTIFGDQEFTLGGSPSGENAISYLWQPTLDGTLDSIVSNPTATILESTLFTLTIIDVNGCTITDSTFITRVPTIVFFNGITPNGDGKNDDWTIANIELFPNNQVEIYNRWGELLFQQKPYDNAKPWTGKFEGKDLPIGTYYYIINLNDAEFPNAYTGPITILR